MNRILFTAVVVLALSGCSALRDLNADHGKNPYDEPPFYAKYLDTGSELDAAIRERLDALRETPGNSVLHNELGALLVEKGFPKDAEREFERAIALDRRYHAAWYNLGLVRAARGDEFGARRALKRTVDLKPGHSAALFQLGLIEERRQHSDRAVELYAKAFRINPSLLDVDVNPRILESNLTHLAMLRVYPAQQTQQSMQLQDAPVYRRPPTADAPAAPSPQAAPQDIVPPSAPVTDPSMQQHPSAGTSEDANTRRPTRRRRPRRVESADPAPVEPTPNELAPSSTEEAPAVSEEPPTTETEPSAEIPEDEIPPPDEEEPPPPPPGA